MGRVGLQKVQNLRHYLCKGVRNLEKQNRIEFRVYGKYALFSDPMTRIGGEKLTYMVPTYEALKGICESIYWKPTFVWVVDSVRVMNEIETESKGIRPIEYSGGNTLSLYTYLRNVEYQVQAHFEWNENRPEFAKDRNEDKHFQIAKRMLERGGRRDVYLGTRECQAYVEPCRFGEGTGFYDSKDSMEKQRINFGVMLHGITYPDNAIREEDKEQLTIRLASTVMENGVIHFIRPEECTLTRHIRPMRMKKFSEGSFSGLQEFEGEV